MTEERLLQCQDCKGNVRSSEALGVLGYFEINGKMVPLHYDCLGIPKKFRPHKPAL